MRAVESTRSNKNKVKVLLENHANLNLKNKFRQTALDITEEHSYRIKDYHDIVNLLKQHGATES